MCIARPRAVAHTPRSVDPTVQDRLVSLLVASEIARAHGAPNFWGFRPRPGPRGASTPPQPVQPSGAGPPNRPPRFQASAASPQSFQGPLRARASQSGPLGHQQLFTRRKAGMLGAPSSGANAKPPRPPPTVLITYGDMLTFGSCPQENRSGFRLVAKSCSRCCPRSKGAQRALAELARPRTPGLRSSLDSIVPDRACAHWAAFFSAGLRERPRIASPGRGPLRSADPRAFGGQLLVTDVDLVVTVQCRR